MSRKPRKANRSNPAYLPPGPTLHSLHSATPAPLPPPGPIQCPRFES